MAEKRKNPTAEALDNNAAVAETNVPDSAVDVGVNNVDVADTDAKSRQSDDGNSNPGETREEQSKRLHQERLASFEYADNYRKKLKKDAEERPMTPAQRRKKAEKEAALAREKEERERAAREAIEEEIRQEKEEARRRAENASDLLDKVEKSLAEKKAQEEAEKAAMEAPAEETPVEEAPAEEPVAEDAPEEAVPTEEPVAEDTPEEEAPAEEPVAEEAPEEEAPAEEPVAEETPEEAPAEEPVAEEEPEEPENMVLDLDPDNLYGDEDKDDDGMGFTYEYEHPEEEPEEERESMILTYEVDNITYGEIPEDEKPAPAPMPMPEPMPEPAPAPAPAPAPVAPKPKKKKRRKKKPKKAVRTPKKARAIRKSPAAKPSTNVYNTYNNINNEGNVSNITGEGVNDDIAKLLAENRDLLKENLDELRRRVSGMDNLRLADVTPASADSERASETPEEAAEGMLSEDRSPESLLADPNELALSALSAEDIDVEAPTDEAGETDGSITTLDDAIIADGENALVADAVEGEEGASGPETVVIGGDSGLISQDPSASKVISLDALTGTVEEIPDSEHIVNYIPRGEGVAIGSGADGNSDQYTYITNHYGDSDKDRILGIPAGEAAGLGMLGAFSALNGLGKNGLAKKIRDNDKVVRNLRKKLREANKKYTFAKTKEEKLDSLTECAEYERSIIEFDSESLAATKALGRDTEARKRSLQRDVNKYNGYAKKLEKIALNPITRASATLPDDILAGREVKRLPQIMEKDMYEDGSDKSEKSYVSQIDNDDDGLFGSPQGGARKGRKGKKYKISKSELRKSASELRKKLKDNEKNFAEHKGDYREEMRNAENSEYGKKTKHLASALNHQREVIAILGDSYCSAIRSNDKAKAKKLNSRLDKEIAVYNKLADELEKRCGQTIKHMANTYAKDLADNVKTNLPPLIRYGTALSEGTFTDSEDITKLDEIIVSETLGSEKIVQVGHETRTALPQDEAIMPVDGGLAPISVFPPIGQDGQVTVIGDPQAQTPTTFISATPASGYQISETDRNAAAPQDQQPMVCFPASYLAGQGMYIPGLTGVPAGQTQPTVTIPAADRPLSERIVEAEGSAKTIPGKSEDMQAVTGTGVGGATFIGADMDSYRAAPEYSHYQHAMDSVQAGSAESATINKEENAREEQIVRPYTARITETPDSAKVIGGWMDSISESADAEAQVNAEGVVAIADKHIDDLIQEDNIEELVERTGFEAMPAVEEVEELMLAKEEKKKERAKRKVITNFNPEYDQANAENIEDTEHYSRAATDVVYADSDEVLDADEAVARARAAYSKDEASESTSESIDEVSKSEKASAESSDEASKSEKSTSESTDEATKSDKASAESSDEARKSTKSTSESADEATKSEKASAESSDEARKSTKSTSESADEASKSEKATSESTDEATKSDKASAESSDEARKSTKSTSESADEASKSDKASAESTDEATKSEKATSESTDEATKSDKASAESSDEATKSEKTESESADESVKAARASAEAAMASAKAAKSYAESANEAANSIGDTTDKTSAVESIDESTVSDKSTSESGEDSGVRLIALNILEDSDATKIIGAKGEPTESVKERKSVKASADSADEARESRKATSDSADEAEKSEKASADSADEARESRKATSDSADEAEKSEKASADSADEARESRKATSDFADEAEKSEKTTDTADEEATVESGDTSDRSKSDSSKSDSSKSDSSKSDRSESKTSDRSEGSDSSRSTADSRDASETAEGEGIRSLAPHIFEDADATRVITARGEKATSETIGSVKAKKADKATSESADEAEKSEKATSESKGEAAKAEKATSESADKADSKSIGETAEADKSDSETTDEADSRKAKGDKSATGARIIIDHNSTKVIAGKGDGSITVETIGTPKTKDASDIEGAIDESISESKGDSVEATKSKKASADKTESAKRRESDAKDSVSDTDATSDSESEREYTISNLRPLAPHIFEDADATRIISGKGETAEKETSSDKKASDITAAILDDTKDVIGEESRDSLADKHEVVSEERYRKADESASDKPAERYIREIPSEESFKKYEDESAKEAADFAKEAADAAKAAADAAKEAAEYAKEAVRTAKENAAAVAAEQALARENASSESAPEKTGRQYADGQVVEGLRPLTPFIFEDVDSAKIIPGTAKVTEENAEVVAAAIAPTFASEAAASDYADKIDYNNYESSPESEYAEARSEEKAAPAADERAPAIEEKHAREETVVHGKEIDKADSHKASADGSDKASADSSDKLGAEEKDASAVSAEEAKNRNETIGHYVPRIYEDVDAMMIIPGRAVEEAVAEENDADLAAVILPVKAKEESVAADSDEKSAAEYAKEAAEYAKEAAKYAKEAVSLAKQKEQPDGSSAKVTESEPEKALAAATEASEAAAVMAEKAADIIEPEKTPAAEASEAAAVVAEKAIDAAEPENKKKTSNRPYLNLVSEDPDITVEAPEASDASKDEAPSDVKNADVKNADVGQVRPRIPLIFEDAESTKIIPGRKSEDKASGLKDIAAASIVEEKSGRMSEIDQISRASADGKNAEGMSYDSLINYARQQADKKEEACPVAEPKADAIHVAEANVIPEPKAEAKDEDKSMAKLEAIEKNAPVTCPFYDLIKENLEGKDKASEPASAPVAESPADKAEAEKVEPKKAEPEKAEAEKAETEQVESKKAEPEKAEAEKAEDSEVYVIDDKTFNEELARPTVENDAVESPMFDSIDVVSAPVNKDGYGETPAEETPAIIGDYESDGEKAKSEKPFSLYPRIYEDTDSTRIIPGRSEDPKAELHAAIAAYLAARGIDVGEEGQVTIEEIEDFINSGASLQDWIKSDIANRLRPRTPLIFEDADSTKIIPGIKAEEPAEVEIARAVPIPVPLMDVETTDTEEAPVEEVPVADAPVAEAPAEETSVEETPEEESTEAIVAEVAPGTGVIIADVVIINNINGAPVNDAPVENTADTEAWGDYNADDEDEVNAEPAAEEAPAEPLAHADIIDNNVKTESETEEKDYYGYMPKIIEDHDLTMVIKADLPEVIEEAPAAIALDLSKVELAHADEKAAEATDVADGYHTETKIAHADAIATDKSSRADAPEATEVAPIEGRLATVDLARAESKVLETDGSIKGKIIETRIARAEAKELGGVQSPEGRIIDADIAKAEKIATTEKTSDLPRLAKFDLARAEAITAPDNGDKVGKLTSLDIARADAVALSDAEAPDARLVGMDVARSEEITLADVDSIEGRVAKSNIARAEAIETGDVAPVVGSISSVDVARAESKVLETDGSIKGKIIETTITRADAKDLSEVAPVDGRLTSVDVAHADSKDLSEVDSVDGRLADSVVARADSKDLSKVDSVEGRLAVLDMAHADEIYANAADTALPKLAKFTLAKADEIAVPEAGAVDGRLADSVVARADAKDLSEVDSVDGRLSDLDVARADAKELSAADAIEGRLADLNVARAESKVLETDSSIKGKIIETTIARADAKNLSAADAIKGRLADLNVARAESKVLETDSSIKGKIIETTIARADAKNLSAADAIEGRLSDLDVARADAKELSAAEAIEGRLADLNVARAESKVLETDSSIKGKIIETTIARADAKELSVAEAIEGRLADLNVARADAKDLSAADAIEGRLADLTIASADEKDIAEVGRIEGRLSETVVARADGVNANETETALPKLATFTLARAEEVEASEAGKIEGRLSDLTIASADTKDLAEVGRIEGRLSETVVARADGVNANETETALPKLATFTLARAEEVEASEAGKIEGRLSDLTIASADTKDLAEVGRIEGRLSETAIASADAKDMSDITPVDGRVADANIVHGKELAVEDPDDALPRLAKFTLAKAEEKEVTEEPKPEVSLEDKNIIPIIINPDDEPINAYLVTDTELIKSHSSEVTEEPDSRQIVEKPEDAISVKADLPPELSDDEINELLLKPAEYDEVDDQEFVPLDFSDTEETTDIKPIDTAPAEETSKEEAPVDETPKEAETVVIRANKPAYSIIETTFEDTPDGEHREVETLIGKHSGYKIVEGIDGKIEETPGKIIPGTEDKNYILKQYDPPKAEATPAPAAEEKVTVVDDAPVASAMSIDDEINHPADTIEGAYRRNIPVRILHGKKESFGKGVIGQHIGFHTVADVKDDTVYIRDFAVAYNSIDGIHDINETQKASNERPIAIVDLTKYGDIRSIVIPKSELKDIDGIPGLTDLGFELKSGRVTFDDESIKSIIHNCTDENIKISFHDDAEIEKFGKSVKKALKSKSLVPISAFRCEINESARDFARGKVKVTIPVEGVTSKDKLVVKYCLDRDTLTDDVFETPYIERDDDGIRKSGTPMVSCKLGHFSYFIITKDVSESALTGKVVEGEEAKVVEKRILDAAKAAGAYTIVEDVRELAPKAESFEVVEAPQAEAPKAEEPKVEPVEEPKVIETKVEPGEVEAYQKEETRDDITIESPVSEAVEEKPQVVEAPKAEEPKAEPKYSVLTSDYAGEDKKSERADYGDTIVIKDTDEEAKEEAALVEETVVEAAPVEETAEESVVEEPAEKPAEPIETITKGYILTEIPEETKKIRGEGNYIVVEHEDSALKIAGKASEEIAEEPKADTVYTVGEDSEGRKTIEGKPEEIAEGEASERAEEIVTVLEDDVKAEPEAKREVVSSEDSRKVIAERISDTKKSQGYTITVEERATAPAQSRAVVEETVAPAPVPVAEPTEEVLHSGEEIVTVVEDEPIAAAPKKEGAYTITEEPDSAKRFEAKPKEEIEKGGYTLSVDLTQAKKIEGRPELQYTVTSDENGKKVVTATPAEKTGAYAIEELSADTKVIEAEPTKEGEVVVLDEYTKTIEAREEEPGVERKVQEDDEVTVVIEPTESEPAVEREVKEDENTAKVIDSKTEEPAIKGEILVLDAYTKIIRGTKTEETVDEVVEAAPVVEEQGEPQLMAVEFDGTVPEVIETAPVAEEASEPEVAVAAPAIQESEVKVIEPKKSQGYIITEKMRAPAPAKAADDRRVVVEQNITPAPVPAPVSEHTEEVLYSGEEVVTVVDDEIVAEAPKKEGAYTITEEPDSAKRFEAKPKEEIEKCGYTLSVDLTQAKKIEGRPELQYTVTSDENGKKVVTATPAEKTGAYAIEELSADTKVIEAEHTEYEIEEVSADTKVIAEQPDDHTGEVIVLDEDTKVIEAGEEAPEVVREVRTDSDATKIIDARVVEAPKAKGAYKISEERRDIQWKPTKGEPQDLLSEENGVVHAFDEVTVITPKGVADQVVEPVAEEEVFAILTNDGEVLEKKSDEAKTYEEMGTIVVSGEDAESDVRTVSEAAAKVIDAVAEEPEVVREVVVDTAATKVITERVLEAKKAKGAYKITEEIREVPKAEAPKADDEILHVGEEIVTVVDDEPIAEAPVSRKVVSSDAKVIKEAPKTAGEIVIDSTAAKVIGGVAEEPKVEGEVVVDTAATKVITERVLEAKKAKGAYKITEEIREVPKAEAPKADDEILHVGEEIVTVVDDEPIAEAPVRREVRTDEDAIKVIGGVAEEPEVVREVVVDTAATKVITERVLEAKKAKGAYKITEEIREVPKAEAPVAVAAKADDEILHVGEEIVTVVDDEPIAEAPVRREVVSSDAKVIEGVAEESEVVREVVVDTAATKVITERVLEAKKAKGAYKITEEIREVPKAEAPVAVATKADDEILHVGEEIVTVVDDEPIAEAPVRREVVSSDAKVIEGVIEEPKAEGSYTIEEQPDSAKRFEAEKVEIKKGGYILSIDPSQTKKIEGKSDLTARVKSHDKSELIISGSGEEPEVLEGYKIGEIDADAKVISAKEETEGSVMVLDEYTKVVPSSETAEEIVTVVDDEPIEEAPARREIVSSDAKVIEGATEEPAAEPTKIYTGYILTEDSGKVKVISAKAKPEAEPAPVAELKVSNLSIIDAPVYAGEETITIIGDGEVADNFTKLTAISEFVEEAVAKAPVSDTISVSESVEAKPVISEVESSARVIAANLSDSEAPTVEEPQAIDEPTVVVHDGSFVEESEPAKTVAELEGSAKVVEGGKILKAPKSRGAYVISESIGAAKVIGAKLESFDTEGLEVVYDDEITILAAPKSDEPTAEPMPEVAEPTVTVEAADEKLERVITVNDSETKTISAAKVLSTNNKNTSYVITETTEPGKVITFAKPEEEIEEIVSIVSDAPAVEDVEPIAEPMPEEVVCKTRRRAGYVITEKYNEMKVINRPEDVESEPQAEEFIVFGKKNNKFSISERHDNKKKVQTVITDFDTPDEGSVVYEKCGSERKIKLDDNKVKETLVYEEIGSEHVVSKDGYKPYEKPLVYEEIGSERIVEKDSYKMPERPLVYEEIGSERMVLVENVVESKLKDCIIEYQGTEEIIRGDMPMVDVLINPYSSHDMGVVTERTFKRYIAKTNKDINHLKYDLGYAKKKKDSYTTASDKVMAHIAMINNQCLICENYIHRMHVCRYYEKLDLAKRDGAHLEIELKRYNTLIDEYNEMTNSKVPHADKTIVKRVLAGEGYEHLHRIKPNVIEDKKQPLNEKKRKFFKFLDRKPGGKNQENEVNGKIYEEKRYLADIKLLNRRDEETANDLSVIDNRYKFESALLEGEKDIMAYKFAKNSIDDDKRKAYIKRKLKALKKERAKAMKHETMDNNRYYRVLLTDTNLAPYSNNNSKKKRVNSIIYEVGDLLKKRDELNSKLNAIYSGPLGDIAGAGESDKWRDIKVDSAKKHAKKLKSKANALKRTVPGFGEDKAKKVFAFNSLLDAKVESLATIDLCKYRLKNEKNSLKDRAQIKKDMREARRKIKLIDREIKGRKKMILDDHYGPDASNDFIAIVVLGILAVAGGVAYLHFFTSVDILAIFDKIKSMAGPIIGKVIEIIKSYLG